jgi:hypothetical protein
MQSTGVQSIKSLLAASGVNMTGWSLSSATGVSADGSVIVGFGTDPSSNTEAWRPASTRSPARLIPVSVFYSGPLPGKMHRENAIDPHQYSFKPARFTSLPPPRDACAACPVPH